MDNVRMRRLAELAGTMSDDTLASMLETHRNALALYEYNVESQRDIVAALEAESIERQRRG